MLFLFAQRGVGQHADAEDIAQDVFLRICSRIADFDRARDGLSWAFGIASYEILTYRRRHQRRRESFSEASLLDVPDGANSQEEILLQREISSAFSTSLGVLSEEDRRVLKGLEAGAASATHRKRKQRALERLRGIWRTIYDEL